ncbi:MAG: hypothetical protein WBS54_05085, partial [Acidobacteriota bacterium]
IGRRITPNFPSLEIAVRHYPQLYAGFAASMFLGAETGRDMVARTSKRNPIFSPGRQSQNSLDGVEKPILFSA